MVFFLFCFVFVGLFRRLRSLDLLARVVRTIDRFSTDDRRLTVKKDFFFFTREVHIIGDHNHVEIGTKRQQVFIVTATIARNGNETFWSVYQKNRIFREDQNVPVKTRIKMSPIGSKRHITARGNCWRGLVSLLS